MRQISSFFAVTIASLGLVGCGQMMSSSAPSMSHGGMAVVDLDKVAAETGRDRQLAQSLEMAQNSLNQGLSKTVENAQQQLDEKKKEYGSELTEANKKELSGFERNAVSQLSQIQNQARAKFEQFKQSQIAQFRAELKPIAQEVAAKRGLSIVIPKNDGLLLSVDSGVDITDDVVKLLREKRPMVDQSSKVSPKAAEAPETTRTAEASRDEEATR